MPIPTILGIINAVRNIQSPIVRRHIKRCVAKAKRKLDGWEGCLDSVKRRIDAPATVAPKKKNCTEKSIYCVGKTGKGSCVSKARAKNGCKAKVPDAAKEPLVEVKGKVSDGAKVKTGEQTPSKIISKKRIFEKSDPDAPSGDIDLYDRIVLEVGKRKITMDIADRNTDRQSIRNSNIFSVSQEFAALNVLNPMSPNGDIMFSRLYARLHAKKILGIDPDMGTGTIIDIPKFTTGKGKGALTGNEFKLALEQHVLSQHGTNKGLVLFYDGTEFGGIAKEMGLTPSKFDARRNVKAGESEEFYVGRIKNGKLEPLGLDSKGLKERIDETSSIREGRKTLFEEEMSLGIESLAKKLDKEHADLDAAEDKWIGRKPTFGKVPKESEWKKRAQSWAKEMGFDGGGANGFSSEATKAHDIAHPITHEMIGMKSKDIVKHFGGVKTLDGKTSLIPEEAIVNVVEHLSRGDSLEYSINNGIRLARVLSRGITETDKGRQVIRSDDFGDKLTELAYKIYHNDNYSEYMKHARKANRVAGTTLASGGDYTNTTSGG
jgi:hypothetical protein